MVTSFAGGGVSCHAPPAAVAAEYPRNAAYGACLAYGRVLWPYWPVAVRSPVIPRRSAAKIAAAEREVPP